MSYISIKDLFLSYKKNKDIPIINISNMEIKKGEIVGFFGPNHVGKSTLLKYLSQIHSQFHIPKNAIHYEGNIYNKKDVKPLIIHIPQDYSSSLFPWFSIKKNLRIILKALSFLDEEIEIRILNFCKNFGFRTEDEMLKYYGFFKKFNNSYELKHINELSGGQKQILSILRSIVVTPDILTMDEPFSAIDTFTKGDEFRRKITKYLKKETITTIIVAHELEEIVNFVDTLYIFDYDLSNKGKILKAKEDCHNTQEEVRSFIQKLKSTYNLEYI